MSKYICIIMYCNLIDLTSVLHNNNKNYVLTDLTFIVSKLSASSSYTPLSGGVAILVVQPETVTR